MAVRRTDMKKVSWARSHESSLILNHAVNNLVNTIMEYESDTFSAPDCKLTKPQAVIIVADFINSIHDHLDGIKISDAHSRLGEIRKTYKNRKAFA